MRPGTPVLHLSNLRWYANSSKLSLFLVQGCSSLVQCLPSLLGSLESMSSTIGKNKLKLSESASAICQQGLFKTLGPLQGCRKRADRSLHRTENALQVPVRVHLHVNPLRAFPITSQQRIVLDSSEASYPCQSELLGTLKSFYIDHYQNLFQPSVFQALSFPVFLFHVFHTHNKKTTTENLF